MVALSRAPQFVINGAVTPIAPRASVGGLLRRAVPKFECPQLALSGHGNATQADVRDWCNSGQLLAEDS